jgi:hypothetical protein
VRGVASLAELVQPKRASLGRDLLIAQVAEAVERRSLLRLG